MVDKLDLMLLLKETSQQEDLEEDKVDMEAAKEALELPVAHPEAQTLAYLLMIRTQRRAHSVLSKERRLPSECYNDKKHFITLSSFISIEEDAYLNLFLIIIIIQCSMPAFLRSWSWEEWLRVQHYLQCTVSLRVPKLKSRICLRYDKICYWKKM